MIPTRPRSVCGTAPAAVLLILAAFCAKVRAEDLSFTVTLEAPARVSAAIYDERGTLLRELARGEPLPAGTHRLAWDGLDREGNAQPPGEYSWRLLRTPGFQATYLTTVGSNAAGAPWHVWVGNHAGVAAVAVAGDDLYVGSACAENTPVLIKQTLDGARRHWAHRQFEPWVGPVRLAVLGDRVYFLQGNAKMQITGAEISERGRYEANLPSSDKLGTWDLLWPGDEAGRGYADKMDMDAWDARVVVVWRDHDAIRWLDPLTGKTQAEASVPAPRAVALAADGAACIVSGGRVLLVKPDGRAPAQLIAADRLNEPRRLALDRGAGELLVAEGAPSHQVKRFSLDGRLLQTYGRAGGRAYGPFVPGDFLNITAIAADEKGGFVIAEGGRTLNRTTRIARDGSIIRSWYGPQQFFNFTTPDPAYPNRMIFQGGHEDKTLAEADFEARTWRVVANYRHTDFDGLLPSNSHYSVQWHARRRGGKFFLVTGGGAGAAIVRVDETSGECIPVAVAGRINAARVPKRWAETAAHHGHADPAKAPAAYAWSDRNGDGEFQPEEFVLGGTIPSLVGCVNEDWSVTFANVNPKAYDGAAWVTLPNLAGTDAAAPLWDWNRAVPGPGRLPESLARLGGVEARDIQRDEKGSVYLFVAANRGPGDDRHGEGWPTNRSGSSRLVKWTSDGRVEWVVGRHALLAPNKVEQPLPGGHFHDPARLLGVVNGTIIFADRVRTPAGAFTADGLYAGGFFDRRADDGLPSHLYAWWRDAETRHPDTPVPYDCLTGGSILPLDADHVLWMPMGESNTPVYRVSGWQGWERTEGRFRMTSAPAAARGAGSGLSARYFASLDPAGEPAVSRVDEQIWFEQRKQRQVYAAWDQGPAPGRIDPAAFSALWRGEVEAHLTEDFVFSVYTNPGARVRLWLDDRLILEYWPETPPAPDPRPRVTWDKVCESASKPIRLTAGSRHGLRLEYSNRGEKPVLSLNWDSFTQERQRIPKRFLYPTSD